MPLFERIMGIFSAIVLTSIPLVCLLIGVEKILESIVLLLVMIMYSIFMFLCVFKTYICFDTENKKVVVREFPGTNRQKLSLERVIDIRISEGTQYKELFTIDVDYDGKTKQIISWSAHPTCRLAMFNVYHRQMKRLNKFVLKCNEYLRDRE